MATVFEGTVVRGFNNKGTMKALDNGYYDVILGALEFPNSVNASYDLASAERIINGRVFKRLIEGNRLRGELGHPQERECKDYNDYVNRIHTIIEKNVCIHIRRVWIDKNYVLPNGQRIIAIRGEICPSGPYAHVIERILNNPHEDLSFSVRSMASDHIVGGRKRKFFDAIITWDVVNAPGLSVATKYNSVSCEAEMVSVDQVAVIPEMIEQAANSLRGSGVALESAVNDTLAAINEAKRRTNLMNGRTSRLRNW